MLREYGQSSTLHAITCVVWTFPSHGVKTSEIGGPLASICFQLLAKSKQPLPLFNWPTLWFPTTQSKVKKAKTSFISCPEINKKERKCFSFLSPPQKKKKTLKNL